jgi:death-on-curing protein
MSPEFLSPEDVLDIHALQIARYGGLEGVRDAGLLESALAQPMATFGGEFVHADLFAMAAAYLFHIVRNHPFVDGNKRTGLLATLVFLDLNGVTLERGTDALYDLTMALAEGRAGKDECAAVLRRIAEENG